VNHTDGWLSYNGLIIRVSSTDASDLIWLQEFLSPQFEPVEGVSSDCSARLTSDSRQYEEILDREAQPDGAEVGCFAQDSSLVRLPLWRSLTGDRVVFDKHLRVLYIVKRERAEVDLLTLADNLSRRTALMRVVREYAMNGARLTGRLIIHGSAFALDGGGVIIAGPKHAGKTTLLMYMLKQGGAEYVSNDRVVVSFEQAGPTMRGMPTIVAVRQETLEMLPDVHHRLLAAGYNYRLTLAETKRGPLRPARPGKDGRYTLSPAQFCELLQVRAAARASVRALLFPRVTGGSGTIELEELPAEEAAVRLNQSLFGAGPSREGSELFVPTGCGPGADPGARGGLSLALTSKVPSFECRLGRDAYQSGIAATGMVRRLLG
jgi:hypothetical protein